MNESQLEIVVQGGNAVSETGTSSKCRSTVLFQLRPLPNFLKGIMSFLLPAESVSLSLRP